LVLAQRLERDHRVVVGGIPRFEELVRPLSHLSRVLEEAVEVGDAQGVRFFLGHSRALHHGRQAQPFSPLPLHPDGRPSLLDDPVDDVVLGAHVVPGDESDVVAHPLRHRVPLLERQIRERPLDVAIEVPLDDAPELVEVVHGTPPPAPPHADA
jgi:hypothetical protein